MEEEFYGPSLPELVEKEKEYVVPIPYVKGREPSPLIAKGGLALTGAMVKMTETGPKVPKKWKPIPEKTKNLWIMHEGQQMKIPVVLYHGKWMLRHGSRKMVAQDKALVCDKRSKSDIYVVDTGKDYVSKKTGLRTKKWKYLVRKPGGPKSLDPYKQKKIMQRRAAFKAVMQSGQKFRRAKPPSSKALMRIDLEKMRSPDEVYQAAMSRGLTEKTAKGLATKWQRKYGTQDPTYVFGGKRVRKFVKV